MSTFNASERYLISIAPHLPVCVNCRYFHRHYLVDGSPLDPGTKFCEHHIRYLMRSGAVPMITAGCRQFVNLDTLIEYLAEHPTLDLQGQQQETGIRKVPENLRWNV